MRKDELKKRSKGVAFVVALLVLTASLSQCHNEPDEELLEKIDNSDNLGNGRHDMNDGSLDASKNNEHEHTHDFSVEESTEETSIEDIAPVASSEASTSENVNSNKKDNKKKDKEDSSNSASTLVSLIENIIAPIIPTGGNDNEESNTNNDNSNSGSESDHEDDNKGWHIHVWGLWKDNGANEIRTCILDSSHTQTRDHKYGSPVYDATLNKDVYTCTQCGHKDQREHTHHYGATQEEVVGTAETCCKTYHVCSDCNHKEYIGTVSHTYGNYVYNPQTGKDEATCSKCNHKNQREHTHHWGAWTDNGNNEIRRCNDDSSHTETRDHSYGPYVYDPSTGNDVATCSNCGHKTSKTHEHHYGQWQDNGSNEKRVCSDDSSHIETRSHTMGAYTYNSSTGLEESHCSTCSHVDTRAHTHHYGSDAEEIVGEAGVCYKTYHVCSDCSNKEYTSTVTSHTMSGFVYNPSTGLEESTCSKCGYKETRNHDHSWTYGTENVDGDASVCYRDYKHCDVCGTTEYTENHGHEYDYTNPVNSGDYEVVYCTNNHNHYDTQDHDWGNYYNVDSSTDRCSCNNCGATKDRAHEHVFGGGTTKVYKYEPDVCYEVVQTCDSCGDEVVVESHGHNIIQSTTMGVTIRICSECGTPEEDLQAKIDIYNMLRDILNNIKNKDVFFDNSLLCDNKSRVLKKNNKERV